MASTFFGLNIAYTGLMAANANVTTTGNNIANVETKGYTRQQAVQSAADAIRVSQTYGMAGAGVTTEEITQIRNQYYDTKYWQNETKLGEYEIKQYYDLQIEDYFTETELTKGFGTIFSEVFNSLDEVYKSAGESSTKTQFLADAGNLCEYFGAMSASLQKLQLDANAEIKNRVDDINSISEQISTLNKQINTIEITGSHANELRDKRALLIDQLSKIVDVEIRESPIYISGGSDVKSGVFNYEVTIAGGQVLVDGYDYNTLLCVARDNKVNQSDAEGLYDIKWSFGNLGSDSKDIGFDFNMYGNNLGGELKGLIEIRDGNNEEYFNGKVVSADKDSVPKTVTVDVGSTSYLNDINKSTLNGQGKITIGGKVFTYDSFSYEGKRDAAGNPTDGKYTFTLTGDDDPTQYIGRDAAVGRKINYQGIPYYQEQMNEFVRIFAKAMNDIEVLAQDEYGQPAGDLFTAKNNIDNDSPFTFGYDATHKDLFTRETKYTSKDDSYYQLTASTFQVNHDMEKDVKKLGTTKDIHQGQDAQDITEELLTVKNSKDKILFRGCSANEFLQCLTSDVALNTNNAVTFTENYTNIGKAVQNQRLSVMGVDNDEEALNLVKYQEAYNLAAKMMQIMSEIYDRLINNTGV